MQKKKFRTKVVCHRESRVNYIFLSLSSIINCILFKVSPCVSTPVQCMNAGTILGFRKVNGERGTFFIHPLNKKYVYTFLVRWIKEFKGFFYFSSFDGDIFYITGLGGGGNLGHNYPTPPSGPNKHIPCQNADFFWVVGDWNLKEK